MNHIGDEETELLVMALPFLDKVAPTGTDLRAWSVAQGERSAESRGWAPQLLLGHDLVLDWSMLGLRIKVCSNTPGRAPTPTEKKGWVLQSVELTHERVAELLTDRRAQQIGLETSSNQTVGELKFEDLDPKSKAFNIVIDHIGTLLPPILNLDLVEKWAIQFGASGARYYFCDGHTSLCADNGEASSESLYPMEDDRAVSEDDFVEINWFPNHIECSVKYQQVADDTLVFQILSEDMVDALLEKCVLIEQTTSDA
jgi:hypothetical protein